jgi:predicted small lipoprotein YifL
MVALFRRGGVIEFSDQRWARLAAVGALVAALGLSACGRKGPLDPPPSASAQHSAQAAPAGPAILGSPQPGAGVGVGRDGKAAAPPPSGENRPFILDWLVE